MTQRASTMAHFLRGSFLALITVALLVTSACDSGQPTPPDTPASLSRAEVVTSTPERKWTPSPVESASPLPTRTGNTAPASPTAAASLDRAPPLTPTPITRAVDVLAELTLSELSPEAQEYLDTREGRSGVAVLIPARQTLYSANGDQLMSMASVVKVVIMLVTLDRASQENREVTDRELELLRPMITRSDNDSTTTLWEELGGAPAVEEYLHSLGIADISPNPVDMWGASRASAKAVALLFAKLALGEILDESKRRVAIDLLTEVVPEQRWGVTAGVPDERPPGTIIGLKDGWYPAGFGWWVNSAGMLIPGDDRPAYTIAILTRGQPSWEYGIATIEGVAERVHAAIHGPRSP